MPKRKSGILNWSIILVLFCLLITGGFTALNHGSLIELLQAQTATPIPTAGKQLKLNYFIPDICNGLPVNAVLFDTKIVNNIFAGDCLEGKAIPSSTVSFSISPGGINEYVTARADEKWQWRIPYTVTPGTYTLTIVFKDAPGTTVTTKKFPLQVNPMLTP